MTLMTNHRRGPRAWKTALVCAMGFGLLAPAHAGWFDSLFGSSPSAPSSSAAPDARQRTWRIGEFSGIQLAPREAGAAANQQPVTLTPDALRQQLALVQYVAANGSVVPLFTAAELADLVAPLTAAFSHAGPGDDVLLLSSARREGGIFLPPTAVTARLFIEGNSLQLIAHDARADFYDEYRGTQTVPKFVYGSRTQASAVRLQSTAAMNTRADWLTLPLGAATAAAPPPAALAAPAAIAPLVATPVAPPTATPPAPPAAARTKPAAAVPDGDEIEQRLQLLKRLRDKNLITEDEYQQKRAAILKLL